MFLSSVEILGICHNVLGLGVGWLLCLALYIERREKLRASEYTDPRKDATISNRFGKKIKKTLLRVSAPGGCSQDSENSSNQNTVRVEEE